MGSRREEFPPYEEGRSEQSCVGRELFPGERVGGKGSRPTKRDEASNVM